METLGLVDKSLYDIGENDLLDVWDADFDTVRLQNLIIWFLYKTVQQLPRYCIHKLF